MAAKKASASTNGPSKVTREHQLTSPYLSHAQKKVYGKAKRAESRAATKTTAARTATRPANRSVVVETPVAETKE